MYNKIPDFIPVKSIICYTCKLIKSCNKKCEHDGYKVACTV